MADCLRAIQILVIYDVRESLISIICGKMIDIYSNQTDSEHTIIFELHANKIEEYHRRSSTFQDEESLLRSHETQLNIKVDHPLIRHAYLL